MGQIASGNYLRVDGSDLIFGVSIVDNNGDAVVAAQTVEISIERLSDNKWWDDAGSAFTGAVEPALITAVLVGSTGIYEYTLTGGFDDSSTDYRIHIDAQNTVAFDYYQDTQVALPAEILAIKAITDILATVDGVGLEDREKFLLSHIKGKIVRTSNSLAFKAQNGTTTLYTLTGTSAERTPT